MNYTDWIARGPAVCDAECAEAMGWERSGRWWTKDRRTMAPAEDVVLASAWSPTTKRNDTEMMVETVRKEGLDYAFGVELVNRLGLMRADEGDGSKWIMVEDAVAVAAAAPPLVAYCAWRALRPDLAASRPDTGVRGQEGTKEET